MRVGLLSAAWILGACGPLSDHAVTDALESGRPVPEALDGPGPEAMPGQFVAKLYTEWWGRAPSPEEWSVARSMFAADGCDAATLSRFSDRVILPSGSGAMDDVFRLFRALLNRDPRPEEYTAYLILGAGRSDALRLRRARVLESPEFSALVAPICGEAAYGWGRSAPSPRVISKQTGALGGVRAGQGGRVLQAALDEAAAQGGGTVWLLPRSLWLLTRGLVIPEGVRLATVGRPGPSAYASMARLLRVRDLDENVAIRMRSGSALESVFVDGRHGQVPPGVERDLLVVTEGRDIRIRRNRFSDAEGTAIYTADDRPGGTFDCHALRIEDNLITGYANGHMEGFFDWMDGVSNRCADADILRNDIVDVTDVGIIAFHPGAGKAQRSRIVGNTIVAAGNAMVAGISADPRTGLPDSDEVLDFSGLRIEDNRLWTGDRSHLDLGISMGTRPWFAGGMGRGGLLRGNTSAGLMLRAQIGILVAGHTDVTLQSNDFARRGVQENRCAEGDRIVAAAHAIDSDRPFQSIPTAHVTECVGH